MQLTSDDRQRFIASHENWSIQGESIGRTFTFSGFPEAIAFVTECAFAAEAADHHPDIDIRWNKVTMTLTTHSASALTEKDIALAEQFDEIAAGAAD